jgi:predicted transcriptional regulator
MTTTKRKVSVSLDDDLVAALEASDEALSVQVNEAIRVEVDRRRRQAALGELLARLAREDGSLDTDDDEAEVARYMQLLGGAP